MNYMTSTLVEILGGADNIISVDCCATRLRVKLKETSLFQQEHVMQTGARGVIHRDDEVQIVYGFDVGKRKQELELYLSNLIVYNKPLLRKEEVLIYTPCCGNCMSLSQVQDGVFSEKMLGDGVAIDPDYDDIYAPISGVVISVFATRHAISFEDEHGIEVLIHLGLDTVELNGKYYDIRVKAGDHVHAGQRIGSFDRAGILTEGYQVVTPVIVTSLGTFPCMEIQEKCQVERQDSIILIK